MANKLKTKPVNNQKYLKGLSLTAMDDVEESVESALENPGGTFAMVSKEHSFKLSFLSKTVKSISGDTKYIRKSVDKFDKKLDELKQAIEDGGGGAGGGLLGGLGDVLAGAAGASLLKRKFGGPKARPRLKTSAVPKGLPKTAVKAGSSGIRAALSGIGSLLGVMSILDSFDDKVLEENAPGRQSSRDTRATYGDEIVAAARKKYQPWYGASNLNVEDSQDSEYVRKYLEDIKKQKMPAPLKPQNAIKNKISYQQNNTIVNQTVRQQGIKELTPTERAMVIRDRLKGMSQIPGMQTGGYAADGMQYAPGVSAPQAQGFPGKGGNYGAPATGTGAPATGTTSAPNAPSAVISNGGIEGTRDGGRVPGKKITGAGGKILTMEEQMAYIEKAAIARGLDPNVALTIAKREGLKGNGNNQAGDRSTNLGEYTSFGPYQLHYGYKRKPGQPKDGMSNNGLGDEFTKKTGLDARDPSTVTQQIDFALDHMATVGHSRDWHGFPNARFPNAKPLGITPYAKVEVAEGASATTTARKVDPTTAKAVANFDPNKILTKDSPEWANVHPDLQKQKAEILGGDNPTGKIAMGSLMAADTVFRKAESEGVKMKVATGGGSNQHSKNHGALSTGIGESLDIKPVDGWKAGQAERYAIAAGQAGANRVGVPTDWHGLHVQKSVSKDLGGSGSPDMTWGYGPGESKYGKGSQFRSAWLQGDIRKPVPEVMVAENTPAIKPLALADMSGLPAQKKQVDSPNLLERAKTYEMVDDIKNPKRAFPQNRKVMPLTPAETAGKGDMGHVPVGQERLLADRSTDGLLERANAYAMYDDIKNPPRAFPTRQTDQPLPEHVVRPMAASVTPPPETDMLKTAQEMAQSALDKAKEAAKMVTDYVKSSSDSAPPAANRIPKTSKNPPPLTNPPRSFHRATQTTNPTQKTPGSDSSKSFGTPVTDPSLYQQQDDFGAMP